MRSPLHILWSAEEVRELRRLLEKRTPVPKIAVALLKSPKAIRRKCESLGISSATTYKKKLGARQGFPPAAPIKKERGDGPKGKTGTISTKHEFNSNSN